MLLAAARRFLLLIVGVSAATAAVSALLGLAAGASASRSVSLGFYGVGSLLLVSGFVFGIRGPARLRSDDVPYFAPRLVRWATPEEHADALSTSGVLIALGFVLVVLGVVVDSRYKLT